MNGTGNQTQVLCVVHSLPYPPHYHSTCQNNSSVATVPDNISCTPSPVAIKVYVSMFGGAYGDARVPNWPHWHRTPLPGITTMGLHRDKGGKNVNSIWLFQAVTHPSTNQARCCLTSVIGREPVCSARYGRWPSYIYTKYVTKECLISVNTQRQYSWWRWKWCHEKIYLQLQA